MQLCVCCYLPCLFNVSEFCISLRLLFVFGLCSWVSVVPVIMVSLYVLLLDVLLLLCGCSDYGILYLCLKCCVLMC